MLKLRVVKFIDVGLLVVLVAVGWIIYSPILDSPILFDTRENLLKMELPLNKLNLLDFVLLGEAGPTGRPLSLATFAMQWHEWPHHTAPMFAINVGIHLINGVLAFLLAVSISRLWGATSVTSRWVAISTSAIWLLSPLLVSSVAMLIQRMTLLAAMFVFLGMIIHISIRARESLSQKIRFIALTTNVLLFSLLATLSKENGAIFPLLILILEVSLGSAPPAVKACDWRRWKTMLLGLPSILIAGYLLSRISYDENTIQFRGFDAFERLFAQAQVLWEYLYQALVPSMRGIGPFHDFPPSLLTSSWILGSGAILAWLVIGGGAWVYRPQINALFFATFWFLGGHLIESTVLPLELYFEHRNYVPLFGVILAGVFAISQVERRSRIILSFGLAGFLVLSGFVTGQMIKLWGGGKLASAEYWEQHNPNSVRAKQFLAQQLFSRGFIARGFDILDKIEDSSNFKLQSELQRINVECQLELGASGHPDWRYYVELANAEPFSHSTIALIRDIVRMTQIEGCDKFELAELRTILSTLLKNQSFLANQKSRMHLEDLLGSVCLLDKDEICAERHFRRSLEARLSSGTFSKLFGLFIRSDDFRKACKLLKKYSGFDYDVFAWIVWKKRISDYREMLQQQSGIECAI